MPVLTHTTTTFKSDCLFLRTKSSLNHLRSSVSQNPSPFPIREPLYKLQTGSGEIKKISYRRSKVHQRRKGCSPWRAQALVVTSDNHKKRMIIDYSQNINRFTLLDAYPLAKINVMVQAISNYRFFSTVDLKITNGVACFQRVMDNILRVEKLKDTFVHVDDVTICGMNEEEHDEKLNRFREVAEEYNLTLNRLHAIVPIW
ncbi:hypothetical protein T03_16371 [Trichinella britovi]|uniref:Reverse transcriptase domain-containing protein n=1 Tax=Trichinella britovi TaxID=45882 RepID=A0A0V1C7S3_TRIBR|nr:hypothetical protein T03_16371 [Trichinella britovi]